MILVYTFNARFNTSYQLLRDLELSVDKAYLRGAHFSQKLLEQITNGKYQYILGIGDYRRNAKLMRVETRFINKLGREKIVIDGPEYLSATWELPANTCTTISISPTTGPCNYSAYFLSYLIKLSNLPVQLAFLHIPRKFDQILARNLLKNLLKPLSGV